MSNMGVFVHWCTLSRVVEGQKQRLSRLLCEKLSHKTQRNYPDVVNFLRCKLYFLIRKLVLLCTRGTRSSANTADKSCESDSEFVCFVSKLS